MRMKKMNKALVFFLFACIPMVFGDSSQGERSQARLFNLFDDYEILTLTELIFVPAGSQGVLSEFSLRSNEARSTDNRLFMLIDQLSDLISNRPESVARIFSSSTDAIGVIEFVFPAPIAFPTFNLIRRKRSSTNGALGSFGVDEKKNMVRFKLPPLLNLNEYDKGALVKYMYEKGENFMTDPFYGNMIDIGMEVLKNQNILNFI